jgi:hypothetical protein
MPNLSIFEQLSQEMTCKVPQQAEVQLRFAPLIAFLTEENADNHEISDTSFMLFFSSFLLPRYMLQMFQEGGCLEWSLLVAVLLKDAMAVLRTLNAAGADTVSQETLVRLQQGLKDLGNWTDSQWSVIALHSQFIDLFIPLFIAFRFIYSKFSAFLTYFSTDWCGLCSIFSYLFFESCSTVQDAKIIL